MKQFYLRFGAFLLLLAFCTLTFSVPSLLQLNSITPSDAAPSPPPAFTVVLDAGHGGEDGGAVSESGVYEKDLNLALTFLLRDLLVANGVEVVLTRSTDTLLYDKTVDYHGRKKALDLAARQKIAEETENCVFVSIHMNAFPQSQYSGLQVWYSPNTEASFTLAQSTQTLVRELLQPQNERKIKSATSSIYLLHRLSVPSVLIECGFLSNPQEAQLLANEDYQRQLAFVLFLGLTEGLEKISLEMQTSS